MRLADNQYYQNCLRETFKYLKEKSGTILVTGASGLIGSCVIDALLLANDLHETKFTVFAVGRDASKLEERFGKRADLRFIIQDITAPFDCKIKFDYIIHAASNADPKTYALYPVETILTNVCGSGRILEYCRQHPDARVLFTSSFEMYGRKSDGDVYRENDFGLIDHNDLRSGYPESKVVSELLFRSYHAEYGINCVIVRLSSIYGPTMKLNDSKAHAQFLTRGLEKKDIVLKSEGSQVRTYTFVIDAVSGIFKVLFDGVSGEAYNIANKDSVVSIKQVAANVAEICGVKVVFDLPDELEKQGFSKPQNCILDASKLEALGWRGAYPLYKGLETTVSILSQIRNT